MARKKTKEEVDAVLDGICNEKGYEVRSCKYNGSASEIQMYCPIHDRKWTTTLKELK